MKLLSLSIEASPETMAVLQVVDPNLLIMLLFAVAVVWVALKSGKK